MVQGSSATRLAQKLTGPWPWQLACLSFLPALLSDSPALWHPHVLAPRKFAGLILPLGLPRGSPFLHTPSANDPPQRQGTTQPQAPYIPVPCCILLYTLPQPHQYPHANPTTGTAADRHAPPTLPQSLSSSATASATAKSGITDHADPQYAHPQHSSIH